MKKYLNEKNLKFVANLATEFENGFNLRTAVELCIDEWYLENPIDENPEFGGVARDEFNRLLFGNEYNSRGKTTMSEIMVNTLSEFFFEYIGPKYYLIQKATYKYLDYLKNGSLEYVYTPEYHTGWSFEEYKERHSFQILCIVKGKITDWKFGFDIVHEEDDYWDFDFDNEFDIDDIIAESNNSIDDDIEEINIVCDYEDNTKVEKMPVNTSVKQTTKKKANTNKKKSAPTKKASAKKSVTKKKAVKKTK
jgi:hypothetical protein